MFQKIVVGVDGRRGGKDAVALARLLAEPDAEVTLVNVYRLDPPWGHVMNSSAAWAARREAEELLERTRDESAWPTAIRAVGSVSVGDGLHEAAESLHGDLLVLGSTHRGVVGRVLVGDDTRSGLNGASCAVAVSPAGYAQYPHRLSTVGVGYDESPEAEGTLALGRRLAGELRAKLSVFEAVWLPSYVLSIVPAPAEFSVLDALERARERLQALEGVEAFVAYGSPAEELSLFSDSVDLLIVGSRGYGPLGRVIHGSTSASLVRNARTPILVLPRAAQVPAERAPTVEPGPVSIGTSN